jgi:hypothetical protein
MTEQQILEKRIEEYKRQIKDLEIKDLKKDISALENIIDVYEANMKLMGKLIDKIGNY